MLNKHIKSFVVTSNSKAIPNDDMVFHISDWKIFKRMVITSVGKGIER